MRSQSTIRQGYVSADFINLTYRISGDVSVRAETLLDQLNDHMAFFITVERMFVSPLNDPATLTGNFETGEVRKDRLAMVVLNRSEDGMPQRRGRYEGRDHVDTDVFIVVAGFEVRGRIRQHPTVNIANMLRTTPEMFVPVFDAQATMSARRQIVFQGGAILVNRSQFEVFTVGGVHRQPAAGGLRTP